jgi:23S rRNA (guanosine2251-2'-O)-methyltransferase
MVAAGKFQDEASARPGERGVQPRSRDRSRRDRERPGHEVLVGVHPVREALRARRRELIRLVLRGGERNPRPEVLDLLERARVVGVPVDEVVADRFDREAPVGVAHQGVLLEVGPIPIVDLDELVPTSGDCWLVALDGIEDPQNLGAILRVAEGAGARGALLPERRVAPLSPAVARASAGALEHLPVAQVTNLARSLAWLKEREFWIHAADPTEGRDLYEIPDRLLTGRLVLVLGAEGRGLRPGVRAAVDVFVRIPMTGVVESLNVASAAAVVLFEWTRRARLRGRGSDAERA